MKKIYFAAPLFCDGEKEFNQKITDLLQKAGYEVFLPQRDGVLAAELTGKTESEKIKTVFSKDTGAIEKCDILFFVLDGRIPDEGACVELGIAYASGKRCIGLRTDVRALQNGLSLNPLIAGCFEKVFDDVGQLESYLINTEL